MRNCPARVGCQKSAGFTDQRSAWLASDYRPYELRRGMINSLERAATFVPRAFPKQ
jgi:hypothetical protein